MQLRKWILFCIFIVIAFAQVDVFVSPEGDDSQEGSIAEPLRTLSAAQQKVRQLLDEGQGGNGIRVNLREGIHRLSETITFSSSDSGIDNNPVVWRAYEVDGIRENVRVTGGQYINASDFSLVTNETILTRMGLEQKQTNVYQVDLKALGITDFGILSRRGYSFDRIENPPMELFFDDRPMILARWPNTGFSITGDPSGKSFTYEGTRPDRWSEETDLWIFGYWAYDWADSTEKVTNINTGSKTITLETPGPYGIRKGQRYFAFNALSELDMEGEYYIDRDSGILYFWPGEPLTSQSSLVVSMKHEIIQSTTSFSNVVFEDITFEVCRGRAVDITGATNVHFRHCSFRNIGNSALRMQTSTNCSVESTEITGTGEEGIYLTGGDRQTLTSSHNKIFNNHIWKLNRWGKTLHPPVTVHGVGAHVSHNHLHDVPHVAISFEGNDHTFDYNVIHDACTLTGDSGAIFSGRDWTRRGNAIRHNFIYRIGNSDHRAMGMKFDDQYSSAEIEGNIIYDCFRGVQIGGGRDFLVRNNLFINNEDSVYIDASGLEGNSSTHYIRLAEVPYKTPPWSERYPKLASILEGDPREPAGNVVHRNIRAGGGSFKAYTEDLVDELVETNQTFESEYSANHFVDPANLNFALAPNHPAFTEIDFQQLETDKMGLTGPVGPRVSKEELIETDEGSSIWIYAVIGASVGFLLLIVIVVAIVLLVRKRRKYSSYQPDPIELRIPPSNGKSYATNPPSAPMLSDNANVDSDPSEYPDSGTYEEANMKEDTTQ